MPRTERRIVRARHHLFSCYTFHFITTYVCECEHEFVDSNYSRICGWKNYDIFHLWNWNYVNRTKHEREFNCFDSAHFLWEIPVPFILAIHCNAFFILSLALLFGRTWCGPHGNARQECFTSKFYILIQYCFIQSRSNPSIGVVVCGPAEWVKERRSAVNHDARRNSTLYCDSLITSRATKRERAKKTASKHTQNNNRFVMCALSFVVLHVQLVFSTTTTGRTRCHFCYFSFSFSSLLTK